jgi:lipoprotein-anchoring transpeptidase ErfK/SrfK
MIRVFFSPRKALAIALPLLLSACASTGDGSSAPTPQFVKQRAENDTIKSVGTDPVQMYAAKTDGGFEIPAIDVQKLNPQYVRQVVSYPSEEKTGTIIVDQKSRFLYLIQPGNKAIRYAVGVGPVARSFDGGEAIIARKAAWPRWIPTPDMVKRNPAHYGPHKDGVDGGPKNPMGARALYMHKDNRDTYYRVHGTNDPSSIGKGVSAGCIRMMNQDVMDLYERVTPGAKIIVKG